MEALTRRQTELEEERDRLLDEVDELREEIREIKRQAIAAEVMAVRNKAIVPLGNISVTKITEG